MQLKTILNRVEYFKSFVYGKARWVEDGEGPRIEVAIEARKNGRPICSGCGQPAPGYDRLPERRFELVPLWVFACAFGTSWQNVYRSVKHVVSWGLTHRDLEGIEAIGIDEIQWQREHKYLTLVYQIDEDCRRLLWAGQRRTAQQD